MLGGGPVVGQLPHRRRRGDRVDGHDLAQAVGDAHGRLVAVDAGPLATHGSSSSVRRRARRGRPMAHDRAVARPAAGPDGTEERPERPASPGPRSPGHSSLNDSDSRNHSHSRYRPPAPTSEWRDSDAPSRDVDRDRRGGAAARRRMLVVVRRRQSGSTGTTVGGAACPTDPREGRRHGRTSGPTSCASSAATAPRSPPSSRAPTSTPTSTSPPRPTTPPFLDADLVVMNGLGYDEWAEQDGRHPLPQPPVVDAGEVVGLDRGRQPPRLVQPHLRPAGRRRRHHRARRPSLPEAADLPRRPGRRRGTAAFQPYVDEVAAVKAVATGKTYAATESVFDDMAAAVGLVDLTPEGYRAAAANESDPAPADVNAFEELLRGGTVDVLIVNTQTEGSLPGPAAVGGRERRRADRGGHRDRAARRDLVRGLAGRPAEGTPGGPRWLTTRRTTTTSTSSSPVPRRPPTGRRRSSCTAPRWPEAAARSGSTATSPSPAVRSSW